MRLIAFILSLLSLNAFSATTRYVDNTAVGTKDGLSWANAWTNVNNVPGLTAGDTVYISGGPSGSVQVYTPMGVGGYPGLWIPATGTDANRITYQIGQDASHNGTVLFDGKWQNYWLGYAASTPSNFVVSGDAGDGAMHFMLTNYWHMGTGQGYNHARISYVNAGIISNGFDFNPAHGIEFDHNLVQISGSKADHFSLAVFRDVGVYGVNSAHDNVLFLPNNGGLGADCFQWNGSGFDIYNNLIVGYVTNTYTGSQHMDGEQVQYGDHFRIWGNTFYSITNYAVYLNDNYGGFSNVLVFNNKFVACVGSVICGDSSLSSAMTNVFDGIVIANNTIDNGGYESGQNITLGASYQYHRFTNCIIANNVIIGGNSYGNGGLLLTSNTTTFTYGNTNQSPAQAPVDFISYSSGTTNSDFHLLSSAPVRGMGTNLSTYFTNDFDGVLRTTWDSGALEYIGAPGPPPVPTNNVSIVLLSWVQSRLASSSQTFYVSNGGSGTLDGTATVSTVNFILSGFTNYSLTAGQSSNITVLFGPKPEGNYNDTITLSGGGGAAVVLSGTSTNFPTIATIGKVSTLGKVVLQ